MAVGLVPGQEGHGIGNASGAYGFSVDASNEGVRYFSFAEGNAEFSVFQVDGKKVAVKTVKLAAGEGTFTLDAMQVLPKGLYFLQMKVDGTVQGLLRFLKN